jgi:gamma-glutamylcyclotransferase (GGCT)/AIG2-like uncharacterized protein YtfP
MNAAFDETALFVYGTLVYPATRERVLHHPVEAVAARLPGYRTGRRRYPYIAPKRGAETRGFILRGLSEHDFELLDEYEEVPRLYTRGQVEVIDSEGAAIRCWVYKPTAWASE